MSPRSRSDRTRFGGARDGGGVPSGTPLALLVAGTRFMEILDGTILASAAPVMARSLRVSPVDVNLAITAYLLAIAVVLPISGQLAERFGVRRVFVTAIAAFTIASALCAAAQNLPELTAIRVLQGVAGALMVPVGRLTVLRNAAPHAVLRAVAYLTWPALLAPVIAPVLGGAIVSVTSWRWIFLINLPLGLVAVGVAVWVVPREMVAPAGAARLDWRGFLLTGSALAALIVAGESVSVEEPTVLVPAVVIAAVGGSLALRHLRRAPEPLLDLKMFRHGTFWVSNVVGCAYRTAVEAAPYTLPLMLQDGWGWRPSRSGVALMALFAGNLLVKPITTPLLRRFSFRKVVVGSTLIGGLAFLGCAGMGPQLPLGVVATVLFVSGAARSVGFTAYFTLSFVDIPRSQMSAANTLSATMQQVGSTFAVVVGAVVVGAATLIPGAGALNSPGPYRVAFVVFAAFLLLTVPGALRLHENAGAAATGRSAHSPASTSA